MKIEIQCPECKRLTPHMINPWRNGDRLGAVSTFCDACGRLEVHELGKGLEITDEMLEPAKDPDCEDAEDIARQVRDEEPPKFQGPASIYAITPVDEEVATAAARRLRERPIEVFQMPTKQLTMGMDYEEDDPGF